MIKKLRFWTSCVRGNRLLCFPTLHAFLKANKVMMGENVKNLVIDHQKQLAKQLQKYLPSMDAPQTWIRKPFKAPPYPSAVLSGAGGAD